MRKYTIYSVDIDTINGEEIRDLEFRSYKLAKKEFDRYITSPSYEDVPIDNIQLVKVENDGQYETIESKFYESPN